LRFANQLKIVVVMQANKLALTHGKEHFAKTSMARQSRAASPVFSTTEQKRHGNLAIASVHFIWVS